MKYNITLDLEEKAMIEASLMLAEIKLANDEQDYHTKVKLAEYKLLLKRVQELKSIG